MSAASFQDTTRVLADASCSGRKDYRRGFKENVTMGQLIPGGSGYRKHAHVMQIIERETTEPLEFDFETVPA